jgi:hypothetical protein
VTTKHRIDAPDTIDSAIHCLAKLQSEGWRLDYMNQEVEYGKSHKKAVAMPVATTVTVRLRPS